MHNDPLLYRMLLPRCLCMRESSWGRSNRQLLLPHAHSPFPVCPLQDCLGELDPRQLLATIKDVMSGAIQPAWGKTGRASMDGKWVA
jgi:hypothetical protein